MKSEHIGLCPAGGVAVACVGVNGDEEVSILADGEASSVLEADEFIVRSAVVDLDLRSDLAKLGTDFLRDSKYNIFLVREFALRSTVMPSMPGIDDNDKVSLLVPGLQRGRE